MKVLIKRFDKSIPLPEYKTAGAAGMDLYSREEMMIAPHSVGLCANEYCFTNSRGSLGFAISA